MKLLKTLFLPLIVIFLIFYIAFFFEQSKKLVVDVREEMNKGKQDLLKKIGAIDKNDTDFSQKKISDEEFFKKWDERMKEMRKEHERLKKELFEDFWLDN